MIRRTALAVLVLLFAGGCSVRTLAINQMGNALAGTGTTFASDEDPQLIGEALPFALKVSYINIPPPATAATSLVTGPDGNLWFTEYEGNRIGRVNPATNQIVMFALPTAAAKPTFITAGTPSTLVHEMFADSLRIIGNDLYYFVELGPVDVLAISNEAKHIALLYQQIAQPGSPGSFRSLPRHAPAFASTVLRTAARASVRS
jgi:hypothetical protein